MSQLKTEAIKDENGNTVMVKDILQWSGGKLLAGGKELVIIDGKIAIKTESNPGTPISVTHIE